MREQSRTTRISRAAWRTADLFLELLAEDFRSPRPVGPRDAAQAAFRVLNHHLHPDQVHKVRAALPEEVRRLCPDPTGRMGSAV